MPALPVSRHHHGASPVLFVADMHLDPARPAMIDRFRSFCEGPAREAQALYILGDLFEVWIGDDDDDPGHEPIITALGDLTDSGVPTFFMAGNRDFLVGEALLRRTGMQWIEDPTLIDLFGVRTLLCHGDTLCTDDAPYQEFRARVRTAEWQRDFLARPLEERRHIAGGLRSDSVAAMSDKEAETMDINRDALSRLAGTHEAERVIHGHTHRPARHEERIGGRTVDRWVLGDWYREASMLVATPSGIEPRKL